MMAAIGRALEDSSRSSSKLAAAAAEWAQRAKPTAKNDDKDDDWLREQAVVAAAMIVMRDGDTELRARHEEWVRGVFARALATKEDAVHRFRPGLRYNSIAIAFVGMIYGLKHHAEAKDIRALLEIAASDNPAAAHGFGAGATTLASINELLPRAVLRCAFAACIRPRRGWGIPEKEVTAHSVRRRQRVGAAVDAESEWLAGQRPEPDWPEFPPITARNRRGFRIGGGHVQPENPTKKHRQPNEYADHQAAALWLSNARGLFDVVARPWLREVARAFAHWTAAANGAGLDKNQEVDDQPREWNNAYFALLAHCLPGLASQDVDRLALTPICSLPDEAFFDVITEFQRNVDAVYFNDRKLEECVAISIRSKFAHRLLESRGWKWLGDSRSESIEIHIGPAIAVLFFNDYGFNQPAKCYLLPQGIDRLDPFLPVLGKLVETGPSLFVALVTLNLLEVSPKSAHLPFIIAAARTWLERYPGDKKFWVDQDIGHRVCMCIEKIRLQEPALLGNNQAARFDVDRLLTALISLGVADARRLEEALARGPKGGT
jgi:hypothetical protein